MTPKARSGNARRCNSWRKKNIDRYRTYMREYMKKRRVGG